MDCLWYATETVPMCTVAVAVARVLEDDQRIVHWTVSANVHWRDFGHIAIADCYYSYLDDVAVRVW